MEHSLSNFKLYEDFAKAMGKEIITKKGHKYVCCDSESFDIRFERPIESYVELYVDWWQLVKKYKLEIEYCTHKGQYKGQNYVTIEGPPTDHFMGYVGTTTEENMEILVMRAVVYYEQCYKREKEK